MTLRKPPTPPSENAATWYLLDLRGAPAEGHGWRAFTDRRADGGASEAEVGVVEADGVRFNTAERDARTLVQRERSDVLAPGRRFEDEAGVPVLRFSGELVDIHRTEKRRRVVLPGYAACASPEYGPPMNWTGYDVLELRLRGDGRRYVFGVQSYSQLFNDMHQGFLETEAGNWITVQVPVFDLARVSGGRLLSQQFEVARDSVVSFGFTAEGDAGRFQLDVGWVALVRSGHELSDTPDDF